MTELKPHISVAPMMDWTDRHCRHFHRLIAPHVWLYTEMVTTGAILMGDRDRFLRYDPSEHPVALQLGGCDPDALAECSKIGADYGYDEINLNCGCPSDRVQNGGFGACLMETPDLVANCFKKMQEAIDIPVTIKCRIAIDEYEEYPFLERFIQSISDAGCHTFIVHARKAWLEGLSPKDNREIPPLRYDVISEIKQAFPDLKFYVNGGIQTIENAKEKLFLFDGIMIGREAYQNPWFLAEIEREFFGHEPPAPEEIVRMMIPYIERQQRDYGTPVKSITRHMLGLFQGQRGAKKWRQYLSTEMQAEDTPPSKIKEALACLQAELV